MVQRRREGEGYVKEVRRGRNIRIYERSEGRNKNYSGGDRIKYYGE